MQSTFSRETYFSARRRQIVTLHTRISTDVPYDNVVLLT